MLTSIRTKMLLLLGAVVFTALAAFSITSYFITARHVRERQGEVLTLFAGETKRDIEHLLAEMKRRFESVAMGDPVKVFSVQYQEGILIEYFGRYQNEFPTLSFATFEGEEELRVERGRPSGEHRALVEHSLSSFSRAVENAGTVYHDTLERWPGGEPFFHLFFARKSFFDEEIGVIGGEMPLLAVARELGDLDLRGSGYMALVDSSGNLLYRSDEGKGAGPRESGAAGGIPFFSGASSPRGGIFRGPVDGIDSLAAYLPVPELDFTILTVTSYDEVLASLRRVTAFGISLSLLFAAIGGIMALFVADSFVRPLEDLREATEEMAGGNTTRRADVTTRDEIGQLAESFNRMGRSLHESYRELEKRNIELMKLDLMKDALMSDVSHELKTPVAKQSMQLEMLDHEVRRSGGGSEQMEEILLVMESNIRRQQNVIRNILMVSRLEAGGREMKIEKVRLDQLLEDVVADHMHLIAAYGIQLEQQVDEETVGADREMLWHVFSNSISNAIKYRDAGNPRIGLTVGAVDGAAEVRVTDNGIGLTGQEREKAFERFFQATPTSEGIGLGLSISKIIVERMGGTIRIESPGKSRGATVIVTLPLAGP
jgi:signal transduction histidine kinase